MSAPMTSPTTTPAPELAVFRRERRMNRFAAVFFALLLGLGLLLCGDYGLSWDESEERCFGCISVTCALSPFVDNRVIPTSEVRQLIDGDCYYGMGFEYLMLAGEYLMSGGKLVIAHRVDRSVWILRHAMNFIFVWCGLLALFASGKLLWRRSAYALIPVALFLLIPRFWAESFYNCKDMTFLAAVTIAGYCMLRMMRSPRIGNVVGFAIAVAFASSIRLVGGAVFLAGAIALLTVPGFAAERGRRLRLLAVMAAVAAAALILLYPVGWASPVAFFLDAIRYLANHPWNSGVFFFGREYSASQVPFYYVPGWMAVTLPVPFLLCFFCGHRRLFGAFSPARRASFRSRCRILFAVFFYGMLIVIMAGCRTCYNGWRQFYFLAWPMLFVAADGVLLLLRRKGHGRVRRAALRIAFAAWIAGTVVWMWHAHPYQNLFFNVLAGPPNGRFELDYWCTASCDALRDIARMAERSGEAATVALNAVDHAAVGMLSPRERELVKIVPQENFCRYFIFHFHPQWHPELGGRPFRAEFPTGMRVAAERSIRSSLFLYPVFVYRIYEFFPLATGKVPAE